MGILNDVLQWKKYKDEQDAKQWNIIPEAVNSFINARKEAQKNMIDMLTIDASLAKSGLRRTPNGFVRDSSLENPLDRFIQQGQIADASLKMQQAGMAGLPGGNNQISQPTSIQGGNQSTSPSAPVSQPQQQEGDLYSTGGTANVAGVLTSQDVKSESGQRRDLAIKADEEKAKKVGLESGKTEAGAMKGATGSVRFVQQYERSYNEIQKKIPGFGETSLGGKAKRAGASILESADLLPETSALAKRSKATANQMARDVEGGRVTDQDRQVYADTLVGTLTAPSDENARLASEQLIGFADQGADISKNIVALSGSKNPTLAKIYNQVIAQYPEYKVVKVKDTESGEVRTVTLLEARKLRGSK